MKQVRERYPDVFDKNNVRKESIHFLAREYKIEDVSSQARLKLAKSLLSQLIAIADLDMITINVYLKKALIFTT